MAWGYTGEYNTAIEILKATKESGANAIGIHITDMETYMTKDYLCTAGQTLSDRDEPKDSENVYDYLNKINMSKEEWLKFDEEASKLGVDIVAMCNDYESFIFSKQMNVSQYVIAASLFHENNLLKQIVKYKNDIIIRIGGASLQEIDDIVSFILNINENAKINLLAGIQLYPTPINQLHIKSIKTLIDRYKDKNVTLGIADHIEGDHKYAKYLPAIALAYNIATIEKHITTDRSLKLEDYEAALSGDQFKEFVDYIRIAEVALGDDNLNYLINPENEKYRLVLRKRVLAGQEIKEGTTISEDMLVFMRCDKGVELEYMSEIVGKKAARNIEKHTGIERTDVN